MCVSYLFFLYLHILAFVCLRCLLCIRAIHQKCSSSRNHFCTKHSLFIKQKLFGCEKQAHTTEKTKQIKTKNCSHLMFHCDDSIQYYTRCNFLFYMCVCTCRGQCVYKQLCITNGYFSALSFCRDVTIFWLPHSDSLCEMHIVIKQFPVCKCPVYTFLLQSLSLDRLLEYEEKDVP